MTCPKCSGLMVIETVNDGCGCEGTFGHCYNCGKWVPLGKVRARDKVELRPLPPVGRWVNHKKAGK